MYITLRDAIKKYGEGESLVYALDKAGVDVEKGEDNLVGLFRNPLGDEKKCRILTDLKFTEGMLGAGGVNGDGTLVHGAIAPLYKPSLSTHDAISLPCSLSSSSSFGISSS